MFLIDEAYAADAAAAAPQGSSLSGILMLVVFIALIYFLVWRPQSKRAKMQRNLVNSIKVGDEVVTAGGIYGTVRAVADNYFEVEVSAQVVIKFQRSSVSYVLPKGTLKTEKVDACTLESAK